jgi:lipocalin
LNRITTKQLFQNYAITYTRHGIRRFGVIERFYKIDNAYFCVVQTFAKHRNFTNNIELEEILGEWFEISRSMNAKEILCMNEIVHKATYLLNEEKNEVFFATCNNLKEHD